MQAAGTQLAERQQLAYLESLGIPVWVPRDFLPPVVEPAVAREENRESEVSHMTLSRELPDTAELDWDSLSDSVSDCTACGLHSGRTQTVFGTGNHDADIIVIGEAPGADEDLQGEPFVGRAGQLLDQILLAAGYPRTSVYIANIVKCRPPNNRNPQAEEALQCAPWLQRQIELVAPRAILALGKVAAQNLLQTDLPIGKMRGSLYHYAALNIPVVVTYHPAYLLRSPKEKAKVWQDMKMLMSLVREHE